MKKFIKSELEDYKRLLRAIPSTLVVLFVVSVVCMNLLANKEIGLNSDWVAFDYGFSLSWLSFLCMDVITKRFGAKAAIKVSLFAIGINLVISGIFLLCTKLPGTWGQYYEFNLTEVNDALDNTFGGTWYVLFGSTLAFVASSIINAFINEGIGKLFKKTSFKEYAARTYISTAIGQFSDNMIFAAVVSHTFFGWTWLQCLTCSIVAGCFELLCEIIFSPIGYRINLKWAEENVGQDYLDQEAG